MARDFSNSKRLVSDARALLNALSGISAHEAPDRSSIRDATDRLIGQIVMDTLAKISVDELNRDRRGIRVKTLQDAGYTSIAQLISASSYQLASIRGIGDDGAAEILSIAQDYAAKVRASTKIRLSADDRSPAATRLILALASYRRRRSIAVNADGILATFAPRVRNTISVLEACPSGGLRWLFASKEKKQRAQQAFIALNELQNGEYGQRANACIQAFQRSKQLTEDEAWADFSAHSIELINLLEEVAPDALGDGTTEYGLPSALAAEIQDQCFFPDGLLCSLRRYQEWGVKYVLHQEKALLGDEMGLGKTIQAIAVMVSLKNTGGTHFLVVCPASVLTNWMREIASKSKLRAIKIHGFDRQDALRDWLERGGCAVTTYETVSSLTLPEDFRLALLIVDEAHYIKNPQTQRTRSVHAIGTHADRILLMTGTALENKVDEMISLIRFLRPEVANALSGVAFMASAEQFREKIASIYYRRKREDVLTELPEKIESREWCEMTKEEARVYERAVLRKQTAEARRVSWNVPDLANSSKAQRMLELIEDAKSDGRKIIVFSFFLNTISRVCELLGKACTPPINGSVSPLRRQEIIDQFNAAPAGTVLPAQIQAGGTGLNIQAASVVILCEPQFKPSIENQAISRAYRLGQARNVLVYRLLCEDTIDERICELLEQKQAVFDAFADESVAANESLELDEATVGTLIQQEIDRINAKNAPVQN